MSAVLHQADFATALRDPERALPDGLRAWNGSDPEVRFAVYRNNVLVSLVDALADTFGVTRRLVGDDFFRAMAREYVRATPPRSRLLVEYGQTLPEFIVGFAPAAGLPYLADVARLEALRVQAYHAADAAPLGSEAYAAALARPEMLAGLRITLHPACRWLASRHAVYSIWAAHQADDAPTGVATGRAEAVLVTRPALEVRVSSLPPGAIDCLAALGDGRTLGQAAHDAAERTSGFDLAAFLSALIRHGLAIRLSTIAGEPA